MGEVSAVNELNEIGIESVDPSVTSSPVPADSGTPVPPDQEEVNQVVDSKTNNTNNLSDTGTTGTAVIDSGSTVEELNKAPAPKSGYLEKKGSMSRWQRRWVLIQDGWLLWNDKLIEVDDISNPTERAKFNGSAHLLTISEIKMISEGKTQRKFSFKVNIDGGGGKDTVKDY